MGCKLQSAVVVAAGSAVAVAGVKRELESAEADMNRSCFGKEARSQGTRLVEARQSTGEVAGVGHY